jgi:hypothetical protein
VRVFSDFGGVWVVVDQRYRLSSPLTFKTPPTMTDTLHLHS